mmetsp:Transcript_48465/g.113430  ORF Transcript_48465/g.113430 Transcript_48465/m.113430 type:complete len:596 (+) Transcript_48465:47-1834(+)
MTTAACEDELQLAQDAPTSSCATNASYQENLSFLRAAEGRAPAAPQSLAKGPPPVRRYLQSARPQSKSMESLSSWSSSHHATPAIAHADGRATRGVCLSSAQAMPEFAVGKPGLRASPNRLAAANRSSWLDSTREGSATIAKDVCDTSTETIFVDPAQRSMGSPASPALSPPRKGVKVEVADQETGKVHTAAGRGRLHLDAEHQQRIVGASSQGARVAAAQPDVSVDLEGPTISAGSSATQAVTGERVPLARHLHSKVGDAWPWMNSSTQVDSRSCSSGSKHVLQETAAQSMLLSSSLLSQKQDAGRTDAQLVEMLINEKVATVVDQKVADACKAIEQRLEEHLNHRFERECLDQLDVCKRLQVDWTAFKSTLQATMRRRGADDDKPQSGESEELPGQRWQASWEALQTRHEALESRVHECDKSCAAMSTRLSQVETKMQSNLLIPVASAATVANTLHKTNDETTALIASLQVSKVEERWPPDLSDPYVMPRADDFLGTNKPRASRKSLPGRLHDAMEPSVSKATPVASVESNSRALRGKQLDCMPASRKSRETVIEVAETLGCICGYSCGTAAALEKHLARFKGQLIEADHFAR